MGDFERRVLRLVAEAKLTADEGEELLRAHLRGPLHDIRQMVEGSLSDVRTRVRDFAEEREDELASGELKGEGPVEIDFQGDVALRVVAGEAGRYRVVWRTGRGFIGIGEVPERPRVIVEGRRIKIEAHSRWGVSVGLPLGSASLLVYLPRESAVDGQIAQRNGRIEVDDLPVGKLALETQNARIRVDVPALQDLSVVSRNGSIDVAAREGETLRVDAMNGRVAVRGALRAVEAMTRNGRVEAEIMAVRGAKCQLRTLNGAVELRLASGVAADLRAETVHGPILVDLPGMKVLEDMRDFMRRRLHATVEGSRGDLEAHLESTNGAVRISQSSR